MLGFFTVLVMAAVAYAYQVEGVVTAFTMCVNIFVAGVITFNFWEPIADPLEGLLLGSFLAGYEDWLVMVLLFCMSLGFLRTLSNSIVNSTIELDPTVQRVGGAVFGLLTGYLVSGFLVCVLQTLPWHENFMFFDAKFDTQQSVFRRVFPPDRVWLAIMHRAGAKAFSNSDAGSFDQFGTFEIRYRRFRRYTDQLDPLPYAGEFEREVQRLGGRSP